MDKLEEILITYFNQKNKKKSFASLKKEFKITTESEEQKLKESLNYLEINGKLFLNRNNEYELFPKDNIFIQGKLRINNKHCIIQNEKVTIYAHNLILNGAIDGDTVIIKQEGTDSKNQHIWSVKKVLKHEHDIIVVECTIINGKKQFIPLKKHDLKIDIEGINLNNFVMGDRLTVSLDLNPTNNIFKAHFIEKVGHKDDPDIDIKSIAMANGITINFTKEEVKEANNINTSVSEKDLESRVDLRNKIIFTIDGITAKDLDDAVSLETNEKGNYVLGVHIAHVSNYIKPNSLLFDAALKRGTSVYLTDYVIPMLPHIISNGICSLNPNCDRLTRTCEMEIDKKGNIVDYKIYSSVINSKIKMNYDSVNSVLLGNTPKEYLPYEETLLLMGQLSNILTSNRIDRGNIEFESSDIKITLDAKGKAKGIKLCQANAATRLIENFMLLANETVAEHVYWQELPFVYRVHDIPDENTLKEVEEYIKKIGYNFNMTKHSDNPKVIQSYLKKLSNLEEYPILSELVLRGMKRAYYTSNNIGHYALALNQYTHFTSPIRRFPDLLVHTLLDHYDLGNIYNNCSELEFINEACRNSSQRERIADDTERQVNSYKMAEYMEHHINEEFNAYITYINKDYISIRTKEHVNGIIKFGELKTCGFKLNTNNFTLTNNNKTYSVGSHINVIVKSANKETSKITFTVKDEIVGKQKIYKIN